MILDLIVIGGGASGMVAAICAARRGVSVLVLEQHESLGKKILATGNGRCNYTNLFMNQECFYSEEPSFVEKFLEEFPSDKVLDFFRSLGINPRERSGYVYPWNDQAMAIREALQSELFRLGVTVHTGERVDDIIFNCKLTSGVSALDKDFHIKVITGNNTYHATQCILATGGKSGLSPKVEAKGFDLVKHSKHSLTPMCPALTGLKAQEAFLKRLSGVREEATISLIINKEVLARETGEVQFTDYGISGIPVFQISRLAGMALLAQKNVAVILDFAPQFNESEFRRFLEQRVTILKQGNMKAFMNGMFKEKICLLLLEECGFTLSTKVSDITDKELDTFARKCKEFKITITGINDYPKAQVTAGGIPLSEVKDTFESKLHSGLYLIGEVLDVDGICGGYNLHFAWGSGIKAGMSVRAH